MLKIHNDRIVRPIITGLIRMEKLNFTWQLPSFFHLVISKESLEKRWLFARVLPINRMINFLFNVIGKSLTVVSKLLKSACLLL